MVTLIYTYIVKNKKNNFHHLHSMHLTVINANQFFFFLGGGGGEVYMLETHCLNAIANCKTDSKLFL